MNETTPPAFIWHTAEDTSVPPMNSLLFAQALDQYKVPYSLHIFPKGYHGLSLATAETAEGAQAAVRADVATWVEESDEWFQETFPVVDVLRFM
ncbi:MAG: alpha/beta hydrolase [Clostridia bacterium]